MTSLPPLPARIGPYPVRRLIAHGGQSVVYEVEDPETGQPVAAKVLLQAGAGSRRLGREYRALTRVDHPNVVRVLRHGLTEESQPFLIMELLEGVNAQARVKSLGRPGSSARLHEAIRIAASVADALAYLHARGIIHRDLKSANVVVLPDGRVKLLDFGAVRLLHGPDAPSEGTEFVGTFHYAAPEQILGRPVDGRTDLYALGVLLYRMLSARRPFEGEVAATIARQHLNEPPPPLEPQVPGIPADLAALVYQLLEKEVPRRPASAADVSSRLKALLPAEDGPPEDTDSSRLPSARSAIHSALDNPGFEAVLFWGPEGSGRRRMLRRARLEAERLGYPVVVIDLAEDATPWETLRRRIEGPDTPVSSARRIGAPTAESIARLLRPGRNGRVIIVHGLADGEPSDVALALAAFESLATEAHPAKIFASGGSAMTASWGFGRCVHVPALDLAEVASLARRVRGTAGIAPEEVRRIAAWSDGRVSRIEALLRQPAEDASGPWVEPPLPPDLLTGVMMRLDSLEPADRWVADALAVLDGAGGAATIARALGRAPGDVDLVMRRLDAQGLLWMDGERPRLGGTLEAQAARRVLRPVRAAFLARRLLSALGPASGAEQVVELCLRASDPGAAIRAATEWARGRLAAGLGGDAAPRIGRLARQVGIPSEPTFWLVVAEVVLQAAPDRTQLDHALQRVTRATADPRLLAEAEHLGALAAFARGEAADAEVRLERVRGRWARLEDRARLTSVARTLAETLRRRGRLDAAEREARRAIDLAEGDAYARCVGTLASIWVDGGRLVAAEQALRGAIPLVERAGRGAWQERVRHAECLRALGRWGEAGSTLDESLRRARTHGTRFALTSLALVSADLQLALGRVEPARELLAEARDVAGPDLPPILDEGFVRARVRLAEATGTGGTVLLLAGAVDRARARGWDLAAARLQGLRGSVLQRAGRHSAAQDTEAARETLTRLQAWTALAQVLDERADRGTPRNPAQVYGPLDPWLAEEPALATRWERAVLAHTWALHSGEAPAVGVLRQATEAFAEALSPADRPLLDRHPLLQGGGG